MTHREKLFQKEVQLHLFKAGYCTHKENISLRGKSRKIIPFPALFACIIHPVHGVILYDTGYAKRFYAATKHYPGKLYRKVTPVFFEQNESAKNQLQGIKIFPDEVSYIILSHFHADHICGLKDFPNAKFIYLQEAYETVRYLKKWSAIKKGYLPSLLPSNFEERSLLVEHIARPISLHPLLQPFKTGYDLFKDGSILGIELSGHAMGQLGIICTTSEQTNFLCSDAAWSNQAIREFILPHAMTKILKCNWKKYVNHLYNLHQLYQNFPHLRILPSHCNEIWQNELNGGDCGE